MARRETALAQAELSALREAANIDPSVLVRILQGLRETMRRLRDVALTGAGRHLDG